MADSDNSEGTLYQPGRCLICSGELRIDGSSDILRCSQHPEHFQITRFDFEEAWERWEASQRKLANTRDLIRDLERGNRMGVKVNIPEWEMGDGKEASGTNEDSAAGSTSDPAARRGGRGAEDGQDGGGSGAVVELARSFPEDVQQGGADRGGDLSERPGEERRPDAGGAADVHPAAGGDGSAVQGGSR